MKSPIVFILTFLISFAVSPLLAEEPALSEDDARAIELVLARGQALQNYDQAAWHTTDALREDIKDLETSGIRGWVITPAENGLLTTYWRHDGEGFAGVYSAVWTGTKDEVVERKVLDGDDSRLSEQQVALIRARQAVSSDGLENCSNRPFNTVVLPPETPDGGIFVYFLTPRTSWDSVPMGGHHRFEVKDGEVVAKRQFMTSCFNVNQREGGKSGKPEALFVTHLLDAVPTELHLFSVYAAQTPIYVAAGGRIWVVEVSGGQPRARLVEK